MNYVKVALRIQKRYKWFAAINITGLSLGIICSLIILLYVNFHIGTDDYHEDSDRIYRLVLDIHTPGGTTEHEGGTSLAMSEALGNGYTQIEQTAFCMKFYNTPTISVHTNGIKNQYKEDNIAAYADNDFIKMFAHRFIEGDSRTALIHPQTVVISQKQALKYFGTTHVIGQAIEINNKTELTITGVIGDQPMNSDFKFDVLVSLPTLKILNPNYQDQNLTWIGGNNWVFVKLKRGIDASEINGQLPIFVRKHLGENFSHWNFHLQPLDEIHFDLNYGGVIKKEIIWVLSGVAFGLVGIVSINYVNLSIAQSYNRAKEIGIRKCLGSSRFQLFFQFMSETAIVVILSTLIAVTGCYLLLPMINVWMNVNLSILQLSDAGRLRYFFLFDIGLIVLAGYYPAVVLSGFDPVNVMKGKIASATGVGEVLRKFLICFQYFVALLFLTGTFIVVNQVAFLLNGDPGFLKGGILNIKVPKSSFQKLQSFRNQLENIPGIEKTSVHHQAPMSSSTDGGFIKYDGRTEWEEFIVRDRWADDQFLATYSLKLVAGRNIVMYDSLTEVLVNEAFLERMNIKNADDVLGKTVLFDNSGITGTVVGVVRDFHHRSLQNDIEPLAIYPFRGVFNQVGVRLQASRSNKSIEGIKATWTNNFPDDPLDFSFLDQSISNMYRIEQVTGKMMSVFAVVSIVICGIGVLGLSIFSTLQRTREIGIRKVLGASPFNIVFMLSSQYLGMIITAFILCVPIAYWIMNQWLNGFAFHVSLNWLAFAVPLILMALVTLLLVSVQSLKTALTNPAKSLKDT